MIRRNWRDPRFWSWWWSTRVRPDVKVGSKIVLVAGVATAGLLAALVVGEGTERYLAGDTVTLEKVVTMRIPATTVEGAGSPQAVVAVDAATSTETLARTVTVPEVRDVTVQGSPRTITSTRVVTVERVVTGERVVTQMRAVTTPRTATVVVTQPSAVETRIVTETAVVTQATRATTTVTTLVPTTVVNTTTAIDTVTVTVPLLTVTVTLPRP